MALLLRQRTKLILAEGAQRAAGSNAVGQGKRAMTNFRQMDRYTGFLLTSGKRLSCRAKFIASFMILSLRHN